MNEEITKCRGCGAEIRFIDYNGKKHPVNAALRKVFVIETPHNPTYSDFWKLVDGFESHFATCPDAAKFRKAE